MTAFLLFYQFNCPQQPANNLSNSQEKLSQFQRQELHFKLLIQTIIPLNARPFRIEKQGTH